MFGRVVVLIRYWVLLIVIFLLTGMFARGNRDKQTSPGDTNPQAAQGESKVITVWKVGSPWSGDIPDTAVPPSLDLIARHLGYVLKIHRFRPEVSPVHSFGLSRLTGRMTFCRSACPLRTST